MSSSSSGSHRSGSSPGEFVAPAVEDLDAVLDAYEFIEILGKGGMGAVYKARQTNLDRLVAIKILPQIDGGDELRFAERFQREAQAMGRLSHPNIIGVYDFGRTANGQLYIVMEYVDGTDLHQLIRTGELTTEHLFGWFPQICGALQYAHEQGIVHRDIKPANIMINREGVVKVADFGLAKLTGATDNHQTRLTMTNVAMGTPDYVAPEALEGDVEPDHRADLYAVGVMLYEMLTGKIPRGSWRSPSAIKPGLDARFDDLVNRAMDSDRDSRFQSASEISFQLSKIQHTPSSPQIITRSGNTLNISSEGAKASGQVNPTTGSVEQSDSPSTAFHAKQEKSNTGLIVGISTAAALLIGGIGALFLFGGAGNLQDDHNELASLIAANDQPTVDLIPTPKVVFKPATDTPPEPATTDPLVPDARPDTSPTPEKPNPAPAPSPQASPTEPEPTKPAMDVSTPPSSEPEPQSETAPEPATETEDPRLAQLEKGFQAAFERDANGPFLASVDQLDRSYLGAIERSRRTAQQNGNLDEVTAFDQETQRMTSGPGMPPADNPGTPGSLIRLRQTYRDALARLEIERDEKTAPLYEKYLGALTAYEAELTKANAIPKALAVRQFRSVIETRKTALKTSALAQAEEPETKPEMAPTAAPDNPAPIVEVITSSTYRELATWILSQGGSIEILNDDGRIQLTADNADELPNGRFTIDVITLGKPRTEVTDDDFSRFVGAPELTRLSLSDCSLTKLPALRVMDKLQTLQIYSCPNLTEEFFTDVGSRPALESLQLNPVDGNSPPLPVESAKGLGASRSLRQIGFRPNPFDDAGLAELARIPTLESLGVEIMGRITGDFLLAFENHPSLESLLLGYVEPTFDGAQLAALADVENFRNLYINVGEIPNKAITAIGKITQLENLSFNASADADDTVLANLASLSKLASLTVSGFMDSGKSLRSFQCGETLKSLALTGETHIDAEGVAALSETFPHLESLQLSGARLEGDHLKTLANLSSLRTLHLSPGKLTDSSLAACGILPALRQLILVPMDQGAELSSEDLSALAKSNTLDSLTMKFAKIPAGGWAALGTIDTLSYLECDPAPVTPEIVELSGARLLQSLLIGPGLAENPDELLPALKKLRALKNLEVRCDQFRGDPSLQERVREALPGVQVR